MKRFRTVTQTLTLPEVPFYVSDDEQWTATVTVRCRPDDEHEIEVGTVINEQNVPQPGYRLTSKQYEEVKEWAIDAALSEAAEADDRDYESHLYATYPRY